MTCYVISEEERRKGGVGDRKGNVASSMPANWEAL